MANEKIRKEIAQSGVKYWQIAKILGLNDGNFSRKLRFELTECEKVKIKNAIKQIKEEK